jgi:dTDP-4-amino-4,6-dideoxygalactose transaminase
MGEEQMKFLSLHNPQIRFIDIIQSFLYKNEAKKGLENELKRYLKIPSIKILGSGRHALKLALKLLGVSKGDEVIIPPFICPSVGEAVLEVNATPLFGDNDENSLNMSPESVEEARTEKTKAIVIAHIGGIPARLDGFIELSKKYDIPLIEDCAQSFGAKYDGVFTGLHGDCGFFSFGISKNINSVGGGALCYKNFDENTDLNFNKPGFKVIMREYLTALSAPIVFNRIIYGYMQRYLQSYIAKKYESSPFQLYERTITDIEAYIAYSKIKKYEGAKKLRNENARIYYERFEGLFDFVKIPEKAEPAYLYFPVLLRDYAEVKRIKKEMFKNGIEVKDKSDMRYFALWQHPKFRAYRHYGENIVEIENRYLLFPLTYPETEVINICEECLRLMEAI